MERTSLKLKDVAYNRIRQMLISGDLIPGQKITENKIMELLGMGRTPVREALLSLAQEQLVQIYPRKYIEICPISIERINQIFELRIYLEPAILRKHTSSINLIRLMEIKQRITDNVLSYENCADTTCPYPKDVVDWDVLFHQLLIDASENELICQIYSSFMDYTSLLWSMNSRLRSVRSLESDREHLCIINAIIDNEIDSAAKLLEEHLLRSRNEMIQVLILNKSNNV